MCTLQIRQAYSRISSPTRLQRTKNTTYSNISIYKQAYRYLKLPQKNYARNREFMIQAWNLSIPDGQWKCTKCGSVPRVADTCTHNIIHFAAQYMPDKPTTGSRWFLTHFKRLAGIIDIIKTSRLRRGV